MGIKYGKKIVKGIKDVICDVCRKSCKDNLDNFEYAILEANWGYTSKKDMQQHSCYFCEDCYDKLKNYIELLGGKIKIK